MPNLKRRAAPLALAFLCSLAAAHALASEWLSPAPGSARPSGPRDDAPQEMRAAWPGLIWAGPQAGPPPAPGATNCRRAPERFEVDGPPGYPPMARGRGAGAGGVRGALGDRLLAAPAPGRAEAAADAASEKSALARRDAPAAPPPFAEAAAGKRPPATALVPPQPAPSPRRPADEAVAAGMVDDNADFGEFLAYRARWPQLAKRELAVADRVRLEVRDAAGRPVPDAVVAVYGGGRAQPLWARTDAGGRAWLMPQPDMAGELFEVQVSKGGSSTRVLWRRGQKDGLQARLDGSTPQPARLDLAFLVDATGSMGDEIDKLKRSMRAIAQQIAELPSRPELCLALVAYRDRGDAFFIRGVDFSNDLAGFQAALAQLQADGGGDYPEAMNEALHTAVHRLSWRGDGTARMVVLVADAPPHLDYGAPHYDEDLRGALARGIKVFSVGASGLDAQGEYVMRQAAQFTGGRFVFLTYADAARPSSGPGRETSHDVRNYSVETLDRLVVRLVSEEMAQWPGKP
jgi:hypothetical protein